MLIAIIVLWATGAFGMASYFEPASWRDLLRPRVAVCIVLWPVAIWVSVATNLLNMLPR